MKYLKSYKIFEFNDYSEFYELFQELQDNQFNIKISEIGSRRLNFSNTNVIDLDYKDIISIPVTDDYIKLTNVDIEKKTDLISLTIPFNIEDIREGLKFVESFAKDQFGLQIEYLHTVKYPRYLYYKSIDSLPKNMEMNRLKISFSKI